MQLKKDLVIWDFWIDKTGENKIQCFDRSSSD
jgi:hypothetical protein